MPCSMFQVLYAIAYERMKSEEGRKQAQADDVEDAFAKVEKILVD